MWTGALDAVFPHACAGCGDGPWPFCPSCAHQLRTLRPPWCARCGAPAASTVRWCDVAAALADAMASTDELPHVDAVTWIPLARARRAERGYDQARALAVAL